MQNDTIDLSCLCDTRKSWCLNQHIEHPLSNLFERIYYYILNFKNALNYVVYVLQHRLI